MPRLPHRIPFDCAIRDAFNGKRGPVADALILNAGVALAACGKAPSPAAGVLLAQEAQRRCVPDDFRLRLDECTKSCLPPFLDLIFFIL